MTSVSKTIAYSSGIDFTYDSNKIDFSSGAAKLKLQLDTGKTFSQSFSSDSGFTYDNTKAEFIGGVLRQKAQRQTNATFGAKFDSFLNGNWGDGDLTATVNGSPVINSGKLDTTNGYLTFNSASNAPIDPMVGTIRFRFTPNYNGSPVNNQMFFDLYGGSSKNRIALFHHANGSFFILFNDKDGTNQLSNSVSAYNAQAGVEIEVELSWDLNAGKVRFFGEGYFIADLDVSFLRDTADISTIQIGDSNSDFMLRDLVILSAVDHTANYTAHEYTLPAADFVESVATLPSFSYSSPGSLQAFSGFSGVTVGQARYIFNGKYWNGSVWVNSNNTYTQATSYANAQANIATLSASNALSVKVVLPDGNSLASVDSLTVTYTGQIYPTDNPSILHEGFGALSLLSAAASLSAPSGTGVKFQLNIDGTDKYWSGSAWSNSDGTYAQSNTVSEIHANRASLSLGSGVTLKVRALLHSDDGSTTPTLTSFTAGYGFYAPYPTSPSKCVIYGFAVDILGARIASNFRIRAVHESQYFSGEFFVPKGTWSFDADSNGYIEMELIQGLTLKFYADYQDPAGTSQTMTLGSAVVPAETDMNLIDLTYSLG